MRIGGAVSRSIRRQATMALLTCEAVFVADRALEQIDGKRMVPVLFDNQFISHIAGNNGFKPRTKHVSIHYHFVKDTREIGNINLGYISTKQQSTDSFTKPLVRPPTRSKDDRFCFFCHKVVTGTKPAS